MNLLFEGVSAAVTTPFKNGEVDYENLEKHLVYLKKENIQAFIINGTTGEGSTLSQNEKKKTLELAIEIANGEIPVIAGTGTNDTRETITLSQEAETLGADGLLIITPYYNKTTQEGALAHFNAIADAVNIPLVLYDVPGRTGMTLTAETVAAASKHSNIVGLKDATGDLANLTRMLNLVANDFAFYTGNDDTALSFYATGGHGLISVVGNVFAKEHQELYELSKSKPLEAVQLNNALFPFTDAVGEDLNPLSIKAVTSHIGFGAYEVRLPLVPLSDDRVSELVEVYDRVRKGLVE